MLINEVLRPNIICQWCYPHTWYVPLTTTSFSLSNLGDAGHTLTILRHTHLIFVSRKSSVDIQISSTAAINRGFLQIIVHSLLLQVRFILEFVRQIIDVEYYITPRLKASHYFNIVSQWRFATNFCRSISTPWHYSNLPSNQTNHFNARINSYSSKLPPTLIFLFSSLSLVSFVWTKCN